MIYLCWDVWLECIHSHIMWSCHSLVTLSSVDGHEVISSLGLLFVDLRWRPWAPVPIQHVPKNVVAAVWALHIFYFTWCWLPSIMAGLWSPDSVRCIKVLWTQEARESLLGQGCSCDSSRWPSPLCAHCYEELTGEEHGPPWPELPQSGKVDRNGRVLENPEGNRKDVIGLSY